MLHPSGVKIDSNVDSTVHFNVDSIVRFNVDSAKFSGLMWFIKRLGFTRVWKIFVLFEKAGFKYKNMKKATLKSRRQF